MVSKFISDSVYDNFNILILDSDPSRGAVISETLNRQKLQSKFISRFEDFYLTIKEYVPHVLILPFKKSEDFFDSIQLIKNKLPETHIIVLYDRADSEPAFTVFEHGIFDCLQFPLVDDRVLIQSVRRAIERDWLYYQAEQVKELVETKGIQGGVFESGNANSNEEIAGWIRGLKNIQTLEEFVGVYSNYLSQRYDNCEVLYFKYLRNHRSIVASSALKNDLSKLGNLGVRLTEEETPLTISEMLENPKNIKSFQDLLETVFRAGEYIVEKLEVEKEYLGFFVIFSATARNANSEDKIKEMCLELVGQTIFLQKRLFKVNRNDEETGVLQRHGLFDKLKDEISRARRIMKPISFIVISIDNSDALIEKHDLLDISIVLKALVTILQQNSRVNDILGRLGQFDIGLILPHTDAKGAGIKGERLRKVIESADFGQAIKGDLKIQVSVGVAEYPSHCSDSEEIFQRADEAMFEARRQGGNKTCLGRAMGHFSPDFDIS